MASVCVFSFLGCGPGKPKEEEKKCSEITDSSDCGKNTKCLWQPGSSGPKKNGEEGFEREGQDETRRVNPEASTVGKCIEKPATTNNNGGRPEGSSDEEGPEYEENQDEESGFNTEDDTENLYNDDELPGNKEKINVKWGGKSNTDYNFHFAN